jgi:hypothetical protein
MSKAINEVKKLIYEYEYLPHFLRGKILLRPNQVPAMPVRLLAAP